MVIARDHRLRVLDRLLGRVEGDDVARVQDAIRQHRRVLEDRQDAAEFPSLFDTSRVPPVVGGHPDEVRRSARGRAAPT